MSQDLEVPMAQTKGVSAGIFLTPYGYLQDGVYSEDTSYLISAQAQAYGDNSQVHLVTTKVYDVDSADDLDNDFMESVQIAEARKRRQSESSGSATLGETLATTPPVLAPRTGLLNPPISAPTPMPTSFWDRLNYAYTHPFCVGVVLYNFTMGDDCDDSCAAHGV